MYVYFHANNVMIKRVRSPTLLGRRSPVGGCIFCKITDVTTRHSRLIGCAFAMTC